VQEEVKEERAGTDRGGAEAALHLLEAKLHRLPARGRARVRHLRLRSEISPNASHGCA
jgi:hypothetical protein